MIGIIQIFLDYSTEGASNSAQDGAACVSTMRVCAAHGIPDEVSESRISIRLLTSLCFAILRATKNLKSSDIIYFRCIRSILRLLPDRKLPFLSNSARDGAACVSKMRVCVAYGILDERI